MRSIRWLAAVTGILALGTACGGDNGGGGGVEPNEPPTAIFTAPTNCTVGTACAFNDASTDPNNNITAWEWNFGDNTPVSTQQNTSHTFAASGPFNVSLKVTDAEGESHTVTNTVTVAPVVPNNTPPVASFDLPTCTAGTPCGFHSTSTDADGQITATDWDFGDGNTGSTPDVTHTYAAAGTYDVVLSVTDDDNASANVTHTITVAPPAAQDCTTAGTLVDCTFTMTQRSTVKFVMGVESCDFSGNKLSTVSPVVQTIFFNLCNRREGEETTVNTSTGTPLVFEAGQQLLVRFHQGAQATPDPNDPPVGDPGVRITGSFPNWTLQIDDGGNSTIPGEPDFNDAIVNLVATPQ